MKTLQDLLNQSPIYNGSFSCEEDVFDDFNHTKTNERIILAEYVEAAWEGDAYVLFEQNGKIYEVTGSHCSCYGLEGQWEPAEVTLEYLYFQIEKGNHSWLFSLKGALGIEN